MKRRLDADHGEQAGGNVADRGADAGRRTAGMAGHRHDPAHRLDDHVVGRLAAVRSGVAEAGHRGIDQARETGVQGSPAVAELRHHARPVVLDQHVGARQQRLEHRAAVVGFEVEGDRLLAAVDRGEIGRLAVLERPDVAAVVARARHLDLDDARAEVAQHHRRVGAGEDARQVYDEQVEKRPARHAGRRRESETLTEVITRSSCWLNTVSRVLTTPRSGLLVDGVASITSDSQVRTSPG